MNYYKSSENTHKLPTQNEFITLVIMVILIITITIILVIALLGASKEIKIVNGKEQLSQQQILHYTTLAFVILLVITIIIYFNFIRVVG